MPSAQAPGPRALLALRQFMRQRPNAERCELCSAVLASEHEHLIEPATRQLVCCCGPCAVLFGSQGAAKYRRLPRRIQRVADFRLSDAQWQGLNIPISLAFLFVSSPAKQVIALFPSPAGATESMLPAESWQDLVRDNPILHELEPDVEALLIHRVGPAREYYRAPLDECYKLVGLIRGHWRGLSGGTTVWQEIARFFVGLKERATIVGGQGHA